jgi:hypothetical protein
VVGAIDEAGVGGQLAELLAGGRFAVAGAQVQAQVAGQRQGPQPWVLVADVGAQVLGGVAGRAVGDARVDRGLVVEDLDQVHHQPVTAAVDGPWSTA